MVTKAIRFLRDVKSEGRKVTWPSLKDTRTMTITVFIFVLVIGVFLLLSDWAIGTGINTLLS